MNRASVSCRKTLNSTGNVTVWTNTEFLNLFLNNFKRSSTVQTERATQCENNICKNNICKSKKYDNNSIKGEPENRKYTIVRLLCYLGSGIILLEGRL